MSNALDAVMRRRAVLRARSGVERERLAAQFGVLLRPVASAGRVGGLIGRLLGRPAWMLAAGAVLLAVGPRRLMVWAGPLMAGWRLWRRLKDLLRSSP